MRQVTAYIHHFMTEKVTGALRMANMGNIRGRDVNAGWCYSSFSSAIAMPCSPATEYRR